METFWDIINVFNFDQFKASLLILFFNYILQFLLNIMEK